MQLTALQAHLDGVMESARLRDYCPNGLQVEGRPEVARVLCGVTASQALLDAAVAGAYDAVLVHHGYFWKGEDGRVVGMRKRRLATLLQHDISLFAYHLPLDVHPELGNNAQLARLMGWCADGRFGEQDIGWLGVPERAGGTAAELAEQLAHAPRSRAGAGGGSGAAGGPACMVHRRRAGLFRAGDCCGCGCLCVG